MRTKFCRGCQTEKPVDQFHKAKKESDGLQYRCIICSKQYHAARYKLHKEKIRLQVEAYRANNKERLTLASEAWRAKNPDKVKQYQRVTNLKRFGLTLEEYEVMAAKQNNLCAICGSPETFVHGATKEVAKLAVDHCHRTGKVRKLLCKSCNNGLGLFKDSVGILTAAIAYIKEHHG